MHRAAGQEEQLRKTTALEVSELVSSHFGSFKRTIKTNIMTMNIEKLNAFKRNCNKFKSSKGQIDRVLDAILNCFSLMIVKYNLSPLDVHVLCMKISDLCISYNPLMLRLLYSNQAMNILAWSVGRLISSCYLEVIATNYQDLKVHYDPVFDCIQARGLYYDNDFQSIWYPDIISGGYEIFVHPHQEILLRLNNSRFYSNLAPYLIDNPIPGFVPTSQNTRWTTRKWYVTRTTNPYVEPLPDDHFPDKNVKDRYIYSLQVFENKDKEKFATNPCYHRYQEICIESLYRMEEDMKEFYVKGFFACTLRSFNLTRVLPRRAQKMVKALDPLITAIF